MADEETGIIVGGIFAGLFVLICIYSGYKAVKDRKRIIKKNARIRAKREMEQTAEGEEEAKKSSPDEPKDEPVWRHDVVEYNKHIGIQMTHEGKVPNGKSLESNDSSPETLSKIGHQTGVTTVTIETRHSSSSSNLLGCVDGKDDDEEDSGISRGNSKKRSSRLKRKRTLSTENDDPPCSGHDNPSLTPDDIDIIVETQDSQVTGDVFEIQVSAETQTDIVAVKRGLNLRNKEMERSLSENGSTNGVTHATTNGQVRRLAGQGSVENGTYAHNGEMDCDGDHVKIGDGNETSDTDVIENRHPVDKRKHNFHRIIGVRDNKGDSQTPTVVTTAQGTYRNDSNATDISSTEKPFVFGRVNSESSDQDITTQKNNFNIEGHDHETNGSGANTLTDDTNEGIIFNI